MNGLGGLPLRPARAAHDPAGAKEAGPAMLREVRARMSGSDRRRTMLLDGGSQL